MQDTFVTIELKLDGNKKEYEILAEKEKVVSSETNLDHLSQQMQEISLQQKQLDSQLQ